MKQSTSEARDLVARVKHALDLGSLQPPKGLISGSFRELGKKLSFGRGASPYSIADSIGYLCAYGYEDRACAAAELLGEIDPLTWDIDYSYIRGPIHTSCFFAIRSGKTQVSDRLKPFLALPGPLDSQRGRNHYEPNEYILEGGALKFPFESGSEFAESYGDDVERLGSAAVMDLRSLSTMWLFGGSPEWPRERIMAHVDSTIAKLHALSGWQSW